MGDPKKRRSHTANGMKLATELIGHLNMGIMKQSGGASSWFSQLAAFTIRHQEVEDCHRATLKAIKNVTDVKVRRCEGYYVPKFDVSLRTTSSAESNYIMKCVNGTYATCEKTQRGYVVTVYGSKKNLRKMLTRDAAAKKSAIKKRGTMRSIEAGTPDFALTEEQGESTSRWDGYDCTAIKSYYTEDDLDNGDSPSEVEELFESNEMSLDELFYDLKYDCFPESLNIERRRVVLTNGVEQLIRGKFAASQTVFFINRADNKQMTKDEIRHIKKNYGLR
jgi:hypothetical protein